MFKGKEFPPPSILISLFSPNSFYIKKEDIWFEPYTTFALCLQSYIIWLRQRNRDNYIVFFLLNVGS